MERALSPRGREGGLPSEWRFVSAGLCVDGLVKKHGEPAHLYD